jgi:hypothetical protein
MVLFVTLLALVALIVILLLAYYGFFNSIRFQMAQAGGEIIVYESIIGDYKNSGKVMDKIYFSLMNDYKIATTKGFGIYHDNPQEIEKSLLRSEIGCIIENVNIEKIIEIEKIFRVKTFPKNTYLCFDFPYKNKASLFFALLKVYPALEKFLKKNNINKEGFVMEIYDIPQKKIFYRKKINNT